MFPSPCGDYGSYLQEQLKLEHESKDCFRPLAGIMVLIACLIGLCCLANYIEFPSPCGDYGSYRGEHERVRCFLLWLFPSPCGDYGSYRRIVGRGYSCQRLCFRPLAGIMVLILSVYQWIYTLVKFVSVPLRGLWFLSVSMAELKSLIEKRFPSPCGDYGSYLMQDYDDAIACGEVSVPLRGLWFLSKWREVH